MVALAGRALFSKAASHLILYWQPHLCVIRLGIATRHHLVNLPIGRFNERQSITVLAAFRTIDGLVLHSIVWVVGPDRPVRQHDKMQVAMKAFELVLIMYGSLVWLVHK